MKYFFGIPVLVFFGAGLQACNNPSSSITGNSLLSDTWLVPGNTAQYNGTETVTITFATPTTKTPNSSASYTTSEVDSVQTAAPGSVAPLDVHRVINYNVITAPSYGTQLASSTTDQFENTNLTSAGAETVTLAQTTTTLTGTNATALATVGGGGPYPYTSISTTSYVTPTPLVSYPLETGTQWDSLLARTVTSVTNTTNALGATYASTNLTTTYQSDDSYNETGQIAPGETTTRSEASNGSAEIINLTGGTTTLNETIGVPSNSGGSFLIPVSSTTSTGTKNYEAVDWYPGNAGAPSPLGTTVATVVGPAPVLPASCNYSGLAPNIIERDSSSTALDVINGTYTVSTTRAFDSNGLVVCRLVVTTENKYSITTGLLSSTTVTNTAASIAL